MQVITILGRGEYTVIVTFSDVHFQLNSQGEIELQPAVIGGGGVTYAEMQQALSDVNNALSQAFDDRLRDQYNILFGMIDDLRRRVEILEAG